MGIEPQPESDALPHIADAAPDARLRVDVSTNSAVATANSRVPVDPAAPWWAPTKAHKDATPSAHAPGPVRRLLRRYAKPALAFTPTWAAILYFGVIAAPRYESQADFVIRTASKPAASLGAFGAMLQMTGLGRSQDDVYSVYTYLTSREAMKDLSARLPLREMYSEPEADFLTRFPPVYGGATEEDFYRYLTSAITIKVNAVTSITALDVEAFRPADAQTIAEALLEAAERKINAINDRLQIDAVHFAEREVTAKQDALVAAQLDITNFRNREMLIDPGRSSLIVSEVIARLAQELARTESNIRDLSATAPGSPSLSALKANADSVRDQIAAEREKIAQRDTGLAPKLAEFEELNLKRGFAEHALTSASNAADAARQEAHRQELYLERIVEPHLADRPTMPARWTGVFTVLAANILAIMMAWLIASGVGEHSGEKKI